MPKITPVPPRVTLTTEEQVETLINMIKDCGIVAFDTETTSLSIYSAEARLISFSVPKMPWDPSWGDKKTFFGSDTQFDTSIGTRIVAFADQNILKPLYSLLEDVDVVAHNYKFDAHVMYRNFGIIPAKNAVAFDTQIMHYLFDENSSHGLKECCERYGIFSGMLPFSKLFKPPTKKEIADPFTPAYEGMPAVDWALVTKTEELLEYSATDAYATMLLFEYLKEKLREVPWKDIDTGEDSDYYAYYVKYEEPYLKAVWRMEVNGAKLSLEILKSYEEQLHQQIEGSKAAFFQHLGRVINLNSHDQVREALYSPPPKGLGLPIIAYTKGGKSGIKKAATDKHVLEKLADQHPAVAALATYNNLRKIYNDYVIGLQDKVDSDGRIRSTFNVHGTVTGRLSSSGPNLQNIPSSETDIGRKYNIRAAFVAETGCKLVGADYSTLEIVITAQITQDDNLIKALLEGRDLHSYTASLMFDVPYEEIVAAKKADEPTEEQKKLISYRKYAKAVTFGVLYGAGEQKIADTVGCDLERAAEIINKFYSAYPKILSTKEYWTEFCRKHGYVTTLLGRLRRLPSIWSKDLGARSRAERQLFNTLIQGTAADLMRFYMPRLTLDERLLSFGAKLILQVHDEVVVEVPEEYVEETKEIVEEILADALNQVDWAVPLKAEAEIGDSWSDTK